MKNTVILLISIATFVACAKQKTEQVSTIDSTLQVKVDSILQNKLSELDATTGQVIVMEVQTGEIKASVGTDSILQESGLVRTASLLAVLETKAVKLSDTIDVGDGILAIGKIHCATIIGIEVDMVKSRWSKVSDLHPISPITKR